jgi:hypothetical protein
MLAHGRGGPANAGETLKFDKLHAAFVGLFLLAPVIGTTQADAQESTSPSSKDEQKTAPAASAPIQDPSQAPAANGGKTTLPDSPKPKTDPADPDDETGQQSKRILWILPNYRAVSTNTYLPPLSLKEKFWLATQDSFDYTAFIFVGMVSGVAMAEKSQPEFGQGAAGYGIYYSHAFADNTIGNYMTEAILPSLTKEDPRYYTLGRGGIFKRTGYAVSRLFITRNDAGNNTFNSSEIVGNGAAAGIANAYYPSKNVNVWVKTYQRWGWQIGFDGMSNVAKEFWPDIRRAIFHQKY